MPENKLVASSVNAVRSPVQVSDCETDAVRFSQFIVFAKGKLLEEISFVHLLVTGSWINILELIVSSFRGLRVRTIVLV